jgi:sulfate adenylyltransferase subunit 1 (EFTu-like GTPase family)
MERELDRAVAPLSVTLELAEAVVLKRGDRRVSPEEPGGRGRSLRATLCWMDPRPLDLSRVYWLQQQARRIACRVRSLDEALRFSDLAWEGVPSGQELSCNGIGRVAIETEEPIAYDPYVLSRQTGSFALVDPESHQTSAAGIIDA